MMARRGWFAPLHAKRCAIWAIITSSAVLRKPFSARCCLKSSDWRPRNSRSVSSMKTVGLALGQLTCCATFDPGLNETLLGRGVLLEATHHQARLADEIRLSLPVARAFIWHPAPAARPEQLGAIGDECGA